MKNELYPITFKGEIYQEKKKISELLKANLSEGQRNYVKGLEKYRKHYKVLSKKQMKILNELNEYYYK